MLPIISFAEARAKGLKRYFTGEPCPHGHISERSCSSRGCMECHRTLNRTSPAAIEGRRRYAQENAERVAEMKRRYRELNPEKVRETKAASRAKHSEQEKDYKRRYTEANKERIRQTDAEYRAKNPDKVKAARAAWVAANPEKAAEGSRRYREEHKDDCTRRSREWYQKNIEKGRLAGRANAANRRTRKLANGGSHTAADIQRIKKLQRNKCAICRCSLKAAFHVDHIVPLARGGRNDPPNLQILCRPCNLGKHTKDPVEFMQSRGRLL